MKKLLSLLAVATLLVCVCCACNSAPKTAKVIEIDLTQEEYAFGVDKAQPELLTKVNAFVKKIMDDGTFDDICNNYFGDGTRSGQVRCV